MKEPIRCCDGCGAAVADEEQASREGWTRLQITGRLRCSKCARALAAVNAVEPSGSIAPAGGNVGADAPLESGEGDA